MSRITRRRFLTITAAACAASRLSAAAPVARWRGHALGAHAELALAGVSQEDAAPVFSSVAAELERIERLFSLYRPDSALTRLNRDGVLPDPAPDFLHLLSVARTVYSVSEGAFDPTVQPLFTLYAEAANGGRSDPDRVKEVRRRIGFDKVSVASDAVRFRRDGIAMTLNGIAQGFATDRLAELLTRAGLRNVAVNAGEVRVVGQGAGSGWPVRLPGGRMLRLTDRAVATSELGATMIDPDAGVGHIFDPAGRRGTLRAKPVTALHESAAMADAASTAAVVLSDRQLPLLRKIGVGIVATPLKQA
ncbi:FAD:protein FMN transferase [Salipiger mucosus]|uniref:FAD:protein FMN transferase n=1 Tax=Salipiger mucosus DSM 16094 TaxID=1123237 RepID=S9Q969_9RHOB|nr:FAD:protein FMN transferase [Salipiger mucosus]EPX77931.1 Nitrous oxide reductase maturation periplasmic protein NosX [Salipiger mucosus DSM 16094]